MAVQRNLWTPKFIAWAQLPCPSCAVGVLTVDKDTISKKETAESKKARKYEEWDPDWISLRFSAILTCANPTCDDKIFVCGKIESEWAYYYGPDGQPETDIDEYFVPLYFVPAPPVFPVPDECPHTIHVELQSAFSLIWSDIAAAGNRVRMAVEALMNEQKVPKKAKIKSGPRKGKFQDLSLHQRIEKFGVAHKAAATQLMAVKWLGNTGSHIAINALTLDDILDAFEHFEYTLDLVYAKKSTELVERAKAIAKQKGSIRGKIKS